MTAVSQLIALAAGLHATGEIGDGMVAQFHELAARARIEQGDPDGCGIGQGLRRGDWMQTFTGRQYWPLDPHPDDVCVEDIAHHLSIINRYCGASRVPWSVGEHSLGVLAAFDAALRAKRYRQPWASFARIRLAVFLHDAPEAYCNDVVRPVKRHLPGYDAVEQANADAIALALDLPVLDGAWPAMLKQADNAMLLAEQAVFMGEPPQPWAQIDVPDVMRVEAERFVSRHGGGPLSHDQVEAAFLATYRDLAA